MSVKIAIGVYKSHIAVDGKPVAYDVNRFGDMQVRVLFGRKVFAIVDCK